MSHSAREWGYLVEVTNERTTTNTNSMTTITTNHTTAQRPVEYYGPILTLDQAKQLIPSNLTLPTYLPSNLVLQEIRGHPANSTSFAEVALVYSSSTLPQLGNWNRGSMIVLVMRDGSTYYPQPSVGGPGVIFENATVWGQPAWGYSPQEYAGMGLITWWSGGVHYDIFADLSFPVLVQIAQSMDS